MRGALDRNYLLAGSLGTVPMSIFQLYEGLKVPGYTRSKKITCVSIALVEYVLETYPDVQKVALGVENDHIRDQHSQFFCVVPES